MRKYLRGILPTLVGLFILSGVSGCGESEPPRKATYPVTGTVYVDGQPAESVKVELYEVQGGDQPGSTFSTAFTDNTGKFSVSTYEAGDGVPVGDYALTFMWGQLNALSMEYGGPDKLKGKYADPKTSTVKVTVEEGQPTDLGRIDLKTK